MAMVIRPLIIAVADPGEGPPSFSDHTDARRSKKIFRRQLPPPPLFSGFGYGTVLTTPENTITYHNTLY